MDGWNFFQTPIGPMQPYGRDELGRPTYRNALTGTAYGLPMPEAMTADEYMAAVGAMQDGATALNWQDRPSAMEQGRNALAALAEGALQGVTAPGRAARGEPVTYGDAWATALDYGAVGNLASAPEGALRANNFRAYHGSPHDFDRFDISRIGTGEGAQAYGHGLYFAESEDVARAYRDALNPDYRAVVAYAGPDRARNAASMLAADIPDADVLDGLRALDDPSPEASLAAGKRILGEARSAGRLYEVQINADPDDFLDWDAPLSQQPQAVRDGLSGIYPEGLPGGDIYRMIESDVRNTAIARGDNAATTLPAVQSRAAEDLRSLGIPGIRYLDRGSRGAGAGTRNFVVFDDSIIDIIRKYGVAAAAPMLGMTVAQLEAEMQAQGVGDGNL